MKPVSMLLYGAALLNTAHHAQAAELDKIRQSGEIVIAHRESSIPFSYYDDQKHAVGYALDICQRLTESIRQHLALATLKVVPLPVSSASRIAAIAEGKASLECGSTTNTPERRKQVGFTIPHFIASARLLVRSDAEIGRLNDLAGRTVTSTKGTTTLKHLERLNREYALNMKIVEAVDHQQAFDSVAQKRADAFAMDDVLLFGLRADSADPKAYKVVGKPMTIEPYAIMLPKDDPAFKKVVDDEMRRLISSGALQQLYDKWFTQPIAPKRINMELPMPWLLRDSFKYPSDQIDLAP